MNEWKGVYIMEKHLYRSTRDKMIGGVCGGIAEYFEVDSTVVRLICAITFLAGGTGVFAYIIALIIIPERTEYNSSKDEVNMEKETIYYEDGQMKQKVDDKNRLIAGGILIFLGVTFLFKQFFYWFDFSYIWPVVLIIIGGLLLFKGKV